MRSSIELNNRIHVKRYGFLFFGKNLGTHATNVAKNLSNNFSQKRLDTA